MDKDPGHAMVHRADSVERVHRDQPTERETGNTYEKSFEIRFDEIDFIGHLHNTRYLEYCSHTRYCHFVEQGSDLRRMGEHGIGAVSLTEEIRYRREVRLGDPINVTYQNTRQRGDRPRRRRRAQV